MTNRLARFTSRSRDDDGWVMIPVIALLAIAILMGFALLLLVDRQTNASQDKRTIDAAQTLADGVVNSTAAVLASVDHGNPALVAAAWPQIGGCKSIAGDLAGPAQDPPSAPATETADQTVTRMVRNAVLNGFNDQDDDYVRRAGRATKWSVQICPDRTSQTPVWSDTYLTQPVVTASPATRRTVWVRGQADVRPFAAQQIARSRASASQVRESSTPWQPPTELAIGAASFSTDLDTGLTGVLQDGLVGKLVLQGLLGRGSLIQDAPGQSGVAKIGLRCGLLDALNNPGLNLCVNGALGGVNSLVGTATSSLGLGTIGAALGGILGVDRTENLSSYAIAPDRAREAFEAAARGSGTYVASVPGGASSTTASCLAGTSFDPTNKVIYIKQVGNGDQYCSVPDKIKPKVLVIEQGRARVTGSFTGVLYAANRQELAGTTTPSDIAAKRAVAPLRETVRIEYPGTVNGAVWSDGAGGQVGLYPPGSIPTTAALLNIGGPQGICSLPLLGPVVNLVGNLLQGVLDTVGGLLGGLLGGYQYRATVTSSDGCAFLKNVLGNLTTSSLIKLFGTGNPTMSVVVKERRKCSGLAVVIGGLGLCTLGTWSDWEPAQTQTFDLPSLLANLSTPTVLNDLLGTLSSVLTGWTAVTRNVGVINQAAIPMPVGAGVVPGTYRSLVPRAVDVVGGT